MKAKTAILASAAIVTAGLVGANCASAYEFEFIPSSSIDQVLLNALYDADYQMASGKTAPSKQDYMGEEGLLGEISFVEGIEFDCSNGDPLAGVKSWEGMKKFSSLKWLRLCTASNIDFDNLTENENLTHIEIGDSAGEPIRSVDLENYKLESLAGIEKLPNLHSLYIYNRPIGTLKDIVKSNTLEDLEIEGSGLQDIEGIESMPNLEYFFLPNNAIADISPIVEYCVDHGMCSPVESTESFFDGIVRYSISGNTISGNAIKGDTYEFDDTIKYISSVLFAKSPNIVATGITLDKEAGTFVLNEDFGKIEIYDWNYPDEVYYTIEVYAYAPSEENPNTFDSSLTYLLGGISAAAIAGFGILNIFKHRR